MIIKGKSRGQAAQAGRYLLDKGKNDKTSLIEITGTVSQDVKTAVKEMEALAAGSRAKKFLYHASINPKEGEQLTPEQWQHAVDLLEKNLGMVDHQRIVVEHVKDGRAHRHILWNRINPDTVKAAHMSKSFEKHELTARALEREFGFDHVQGVHVLENNQEPAERGPTHNEIAQSEKTGVNVRQWRKEIRKLAAGAEGNGADLIATLESKGHMVARGEKVDFVILDPSGTPHRMAQSLGFRVKDLKEKLSDIKPENLPDVEQAQERQKEIIANLEREKEERTKAQAAQLAASMYDRGGMASQQKDALRHAKDKTDAKQRAAQIEEQWRKNNQQRDARESEKKEGRGTGKESSKTQAEVKRDDKKARTEQTDGKQRRSAKDVMREVFETDFSRKQKGGGRDRGDDFGRERER
jgi:hypothetical protein